MRLSEGLLDTGFLIFPLGQLVVQDEGIHRGERISLYDLQVLWRTLYITRGIKKVHFSHAFAGTKKMFVCVQLSLKLFIPLEKSDLKLLLFDQVFFVLFFF